MQLKHERIINSNFDSTVIFSPNHSIGQVKEIDNDSHYVISDPASRPPHNEQWFIEYLKSFFLQKNSRKRYKNLPEIDRSEPMMNYD